MGISFRHSAGFGKRMEYNLVGKMLMEGLDVYMPLVDDHGVDCVIKKESAASGLMGIGRIKKPESRRNTARNSLRNTLRRISQDSTKALCKEKT